MISTGCPANKRFDILSCLLDCKKQQIQQDEMQQLKATHLAKIRALQLQHVARLHTMLCCLQLAAPKKPYLPGSLARKIAIMAYNKDEHAYRHAPYNPQRERLFSFVKPAKQS